MTLVLEEKRSRVISFAFTASRKGRFFVVRGFWLCYNHGINIYMR